MSSAGLRSVEVEAPNVSVSVQPSSSNNMDNDDHGDHGGGRGHRDHANTPTAIANSIANQFDNTSNIYTKYNDAAGPADLAEDFIHVSHLDNIYSNTNNDLKSSGNTASMTITDTFTTSHGGGEGGHGGVMNEIIELMEEADEEDIMIPSSSSLFYSTPSTYYDNVNRGQLTPIISEGGMETTSLFSIDINRLWSSSDHRLVYVAVGNGNSSLDALLWTLNHSVHPSITLVYLIHIYPKIKLIPSPLGGGWVPKSQVSPQLVESYVALDRSKRKELLRKYIDICSAHLVQVETILIENDSVANAILELISILNIPKLVVGISKSNLRKLKGGRGSGTIADQIVQSAGVGCEVKIICQGKDMSEHEDHHQDPTSPMTSSSSKSSKSTAAAPEEAAATIIRRGAENDDEVQQQQHPPDNTTSFSCCFRPNF